MNACDTGISGSLRFTLPLLPRKSIAIIIPLNSVKIMTQESEEIRLRYLYRNLILQGKARISLDSARRLVGPDCAFHLYKIVDLKKNRKKG